MLRNSKDLAGCATGATDGTGGEVKDLYFDDEAWVIRYLVISTGAWLANRKIPISQHQRDDPHLRSCNAVLKFHIHASDGYLGHVEGLLVDDETWAIHYLIVDASNWWLGHQVLVAPQWIQDVNWFSSNVSVDLSRKTLKDAPAYAAASSLDRQQEIELLEYYDRNSANLITRQPRRMPSP
jgi:hypothetical protein